MLSEMKIRRRFWIRACCALACSVAIVAALVSCSSTITDRGAIMIVVDLATDSACNPIAMIEQFGSLHGLQLEGQHDPPLRGHQFSLIDVKLDGKPVMTVSETIESGIRSRKGPSPVQIQFVFFVPAEPVPQDLHDAQALAQGFTDWFVKQPSQCWHIVSQVEADLRRYMKP